MKQFIEQRKPWRILEGNDARVALQAHMSPSSFADLEALFDRYPTSVVEFGIYSCNIGNIPGRNTIIWEVRDY